MFRLKIKSSNNEQLSYIKHKINQAFLHLKQNSELFVQLPNFSPAQWEMSTPRHAQVRTFDFRCTPISTYACSISYSLVYKLSKLGASLYGSIWLSDFEMRKKSKQSHHDCARSSFHKKNTKSPNSRAKWSTPWCNSTLMQPLY